MSVPLASADFEVFRDRTTLPNLPVSRPPVAELGSEKEPFLEVRLPFRVQPRCAARAALAVLNAGLHRRSGVRLSWGSSSLRRSTRGAPFLPRSARPTAGDEGCHAPVRCRPRASSPDRARLAAPSTGFRSPSAVSAAPAPVNASCPAPPVPPTLRPRASRSVARPHRPWDSPYRAFPSRGAVPPLDGLLLPCGFDFDRVSGAKIPWLSDRFPPRAPP